MGICILTVFYVNTALLLCSVDRSLANNPLSSSKSNGQTLASFANLRNL